MAPPSFSSPFRVAMSIARSLWDAGRYTWELTGRASDYLAVNPAKLITLMSSIVTIVVLSYYGGESSPQGALATGAEGSLTGGGLSLVMPRSSPLNPPLASAASTAPAASSSSVSDGAPAAEPGPYTVECGQYLQTSTASSASAMPPMATTAEAATALADELPLWPRPRQARWLTEEQQQQQQQQRPGGKKSSSSSSSPSSSWGLSTSFRFVVTDWPPPSVNGYGGDEALAHSCSRVCGLLWTPPPPQQQQHSNNDGAAADATEGAVLPLLHRIERLEITIGEGGSRRRGRNRRGRRRTAADNSSEGTDDDGRGGAVEAPRLLPTAAEAYSLVVGPGPVATLTAPSAAGALNGLETFAQLFSEAHPTLLAPPATSLPAEATTATAAPATTTTTPAATNGTTATTTTTTTTTTTAATATAAAANC